MQHEGLDCCYRSRNVRLSLMSALLLEAPLNRCFIGDAQALLPDAQASQQRYIVSYETAGKGGFE